jgi:hypothetical protein
MAAGQRTSWTSKFHEQRLEEFQEIGKKRKMISTFILTLRLLSPSGEWEGGGGMDQNVANIQAFI